MHPEIRKVGPGNCPKCGMALEPLLPSLDEDDQNLRSVRRRFFIAAALAVPLLLIAMGPHVFGMPANAATAQMLRALEMLLSAPLVLWAGAPYYVRGWKGVLSRSPNMYTLIGLGVLAAFGFSLVATFMAASFPPAMRDMHGRVGVYFEAAGVIVALVLLGEWLELRARGKTSAAIRGLLDLTPAMARRVRADGSEEEIELGAVQSGDLLRIRPGGKVPVDGVVVDGASSVDESMLTGESIPLEKSSGDALTAGSVNGSGSLTLRAERVGHATMLAQIVDLVAKAQRSNAPLQRWADRVSQVFVPAVIAIALATFGVWLVWGPQPRLAYALVNAVAVLIIACPCALGLATPISITVAMGRARASRRALPQRGRDRGAGRRRRARARQDRNIDRRQARADRHRRHRWRARKRGARPRRSARGGQRTSARARHSGRRDAARTRRRARRRFFPPSPVKAYADASERRRSSSATRP